MTFRWIAALLLIAGTAQAQVRQSGTVTPGHLSCWTTTGVVQDCGTPTNPSVTGGLGIISSNAQSIAIDNAKITGAYNQLGFGVTASAANITSQAFGGAAELPLNIVAKTLTFIVNGVPFPYPNPVSGPFLPIAGGTMTGPLNMVFSQPAATHATLGWLTGNQTFGGTFSSAFAPMNILQIGDSMGIIGGSGQGFFIQLNSGGATLQGGRTAIQGDMVITSATGNAGQGQYVGVQGNAFLPAGVSEPGGIIYGGNFTSQLFTGASTGSSGNGYIVGVEIDVGAQAGTVTRAVVGLSIVPFGNWAVPGTAGNDTALGFGDQGQTGGGWDTLINLVGLSGHSPIKSTGRLFWAQTPMTIAKGFDLLNMTFTGSAWLSAEFNVFGAPINSASISTTHGILMGAGVIAGVDIPITTSNGSNIALIPTASGVVKVASSLLIQSAGQANLLALVGATAGNGVNIFAQGTDTNISMNLNMQGTGGVNVRSNAGNTLIASFPGSTTADGYPSFIPGIAASLPLQMFANGAPNNILIGGSSAGGGGVATTATAGFLMIPFASGLPTGTPLNSASGAALVNDTVDHKLCWHEPGGTWVCVVGS